MKSTASAPRYSRKDTAGRKDVRNFCGRLLLQATNEVDQVILAALHVALFITPDPTFNAWRKEVLERHCKTHNVTLKLNK